MQSEVLTLFKALADANRLKIVGLLAQEPRSVEELAELLELRDSTTSHHLRRLSKVGLVEAKTDGHYSIYHLQTQVLQDVAKTAFEADKLPALADDVDRSAYERKILQTFVGANGEVMAFPTQQKKYLVILRYVLDAFETDKRYSEREVNAVLERYNEDTARLRRSFVDFGLMAREGGGGAYWRVEPSVSP
ncbi:hypothetical protein BH24DEI2_BH24DEI2_10290 [soil metagenome]